MLTCLRLRCLLAVASTPPSAPVEPASRAAPPPLPPSVCALCSQPGRCVYTEKLCRPPPRCSAVQPASSYVCVCRCSDLHAWPECASEPTHKTELHVCSRNISVGAVEKNTPPPPTTKLEMHRRKRRVGTAVWRDLTSEEVRVDVRPRGRGSGPPSFHTYADSAPSDSGASRMPLGQRAPRSETSCLLFEDGFIKAGPTALVLLEPMLRTISSGRNVPTLASVWADLRGSGVSGRSHSSRKHSHTSQM